MKFSKSRFLSFFSLLFFMAGLAVGATPKNENFEILEQETVEEQGPKSVLAIDENFEQQAEDQYFQIEETPLKIALILSSPSSNKDMEFTRGFIVGLKDLNMPENSVDLKVVNGEIVEDSLINELEIYDPYAMVVTHDKQIPSTLLEFAQEKNIKVLNVFDAKNEDFTNSPNLFQILIPSNRFNKKITDYILNEFADNYLVVVGEPDSGDQVLTALLPLLPSSRVIQTSAEDLPKLELEENTSYLFYPSSASKSEITDVLEKVQLLMADYITADVTIMGRPSWVGLNELNSIISNLRVYIPAKCYFNAGSMDGKKFITEYNSLFSHTPVRSYPVYAVMGYDIARYFVPGLYGEEQISEEYDWRPQETLQSYFNLVKDGWFSGYYNDGAYMLKFEPWGSMQRIRL